MGRNESLVSLTLHPDAFRSLSKGRLKYRHKAELKGSSSKAAYGYSFKF